MSKTISKRASFLNASGGGATGGGGGVVTGDPENDTLIETFRTVMNLKENTMKTYCKDLSSFSLFLKESRGATLAQATKEDVKAFLNHLKKQGKGSATIAYHLTAIKSFFGHFFANGTIGSNPAVGIKGPKTERKKPKPVPLTNQEVEDLLAAPDAATPFGLRDCAMMGVAVYCGLRASEIVGLQIKDVDFQEKEIRVKGKGGRGRIVPLGDAAEQLCRAHLEHERNETSEEAEDEKFFQNCSGEGINRTSFFTIVKKHARAANLPSSVSPHVLRHTFASNAIRDGVDIQDLQRLMGHAYTTTTKRYVAISPERLTEEYHFFHSRAIGIQTKE